MRLLDAPPISTVKITPLWHIAKDGDPAGLALYERHYSNRNPNRRIRQFVGPGESIVLLTEGGDALFVWRRFMENGQSEPIGINCAVFRNESHHRSSDLIRQADAVAFNRWPGERHYTFVDPKSVRSSNPGCCFKKAGWKQTDRVTSRGYIELELEAPNAE